MMAALAAPADKRFRRAQVKPGRRRKVGVRHVWRLARLAGVLSIAVYGGWRGTTLLFGANALQISRLTVHGNERLSTGEVLAILDGLMGRNILTVGIDEWQERLLASPWVEAATLRRRLPSHIEVSIIERHPIGIARIGRSLYLVDDQGVVIDDYGPTYADYDLPMVDGLAGRPGENVSVIDERRAILAARVIAALGPRPDLAKRVSQIDVADPHNAVVMLENDTALLRLGNEDFAERIQQYLDLAPALRDRLHEIDYVDLRFGDRLYVKPVKK
jgi:cell division protein FtsQ